MKPADPTLERVRTLRAYHQRSKHQPQRFAAGPDTLDWDAQPDPFRRWAGAPLAMLPLVADSLSAPWADLFVPARVPARAVSRSAIGALFELSLALTAWKQFGPDRWALRANPSSGNLHPTEAFLIASGVAGLDDGLYHYAPREHALELRTARVVDAADVAQRAPQMWIGLSSIQWREAWKYGERAFRYCQLDVGHAMGALRYAAATIGWQARVVSGLGHAELATLLGLDRDGDFGTAEREEPELLLQIGPALPATPEVPAAWAHSAAWHGQANRLDRHPMYRWPVIAEVADATREPAGSGPVAHAAVPSIMQMAAPASDQMAAGAPRAHLPAATLIRQRRSAQHFERRATMPVAAFMRIAAALMPDTGCLPWDIRAQAPRVHAVLYAHRIDGLAPGAYVLPRSAAGASLLAESLHTGQPWEPVTEAPARLPLQRIAEHPALAGSLRTLSCHQAIGSDACLAVSLLAEFDAVIDAAPWRYRELYQEAGLIGQVLYLQAEAEGFRGTGIGCYFDDAVHELLGITGTRVQVLYHFTVGVPLADGRIETVAPYAERGPITALD